MVSVKDVIGRLKEQEILYSILPPESQLEMRRRALTVAYTSAHTETTEAARRLARGDMMEGQRLAIDRRLPLDHTEWDKSRRRELGEGYRWDRWPAKARFARALAGITLGAGAVCLDTHMLALPVGERPKTALEQWEKWFTVYRERYGNEKANWCLGWHHRLLRWIAGEPVSIGIE